MFLLKTKFTILPATPKINLKHIFKLLLPQTLLKQSDTTVWHFSTKKGGVLLSVWDQDFSIIVIFVSNGMILKSMDESTPLSNDEHLTPNIDEVMIVDIFWKGL